MKSSGELFLERKQSRRLGVYVREATWWPRGTEARLPPGRAPHPRGPHVAPRTYFFFLYIPIYTKTFGEPNRSGVPPPRNPTEAIESCGEKCANLCRVYNLIMVSCVPGYGHLEYLVLGLS